MSLAIAEKKPPFWFWVAAGLGLAWNVFGIYQFVGSVFGSQADLMARGMTASQAAAYAAIPLWMNLAFAIGVFGGLLGSVLLMLRNRVATPVFAASLAGYVVLYIGDITEGIFAVMGPPQVVVLTAVVLIAAALLWSSRRFERSGVLA
jgi:hypothetical protein